MIRPCPILERFTGERHELADMEALLIKALGLSPNINRMNFRSAQMWEQVKSHEVPYILDENQYRAVTGRSPSGHFLDSPKKCAFDLLAEVAR